MLKHYYYVGGMPEAVLAFQTNFLLDTGSAVVPLEVKAEVNLQSKSLKAFTEKYHPDLSVRTSMADYKRQDWLLNIPLYAISRLSEEAGIV